MGTVYRKTFTKPLPADADNADKLAEFFGLEIVEKRKPR